MWSNLQKFDGRKPFRIDVGGYYLISDELSGFAQESKKKPSNLVNKIITLKENEFIRGQQIQ